jgi:hypothetical protein
LPFTIGSDLAILIQALSAAVSALATIVLVVVTIRYVRATQGMLSEMRTTRERSDAARVLAYAESGEYGPVLALANVGGSPAFDVRVMNRSGGPVSIRDEPAVPDGEAIIDVAFLAPSQVVRTHAAFATLGSRQGDYPPFAVECRWTSGTGDAGAERSVIAIGAVLFTLKPGSLAEVAKAITDLRSSLRH